MKQKMKINNKLSRLNIRHALLATILCISNTVFSQDDTTQALEDFGDIMQFALPLTALGTTYALGDSEGSKQFYKSFFTALGTTTTLKGVYSKLRPASGSRTSFPSGHTTAAFAGAAFIDQRYGHGWGSIAYTAAGITGYSRVRSENHFADDVVAGASIAIMSNWLWVTPYESNVTIAPILIGNGVGMGITVTDEDVEKKHKIDIGKLTPKFRYELSMGGAYLQKNEVTAPGASGTTFDLNNFDKVDDPTTSANALLSWFVTDQSQLRFTFWPFESRDTGQFSSAVDFAGETFPANTDIKSAWRHYDLRATYIYDLTPKSDWYVAVGGSLSAQFTEIDLTTADGSVSSTVDDVVILPLLLASVGYDFTNKLGLYAEVNGIALSDDHALDGNLNIRYKLNRYWDVGAGVGFYEREVDTSELKNDFRYDTAYITVGYTMY